MARWWQELALQTKLMIIAVVWAALALPPAYAGLQSHAGSGPLAVSWQSFVGDPGGYGVLPSLGHKS